MESQKKIVNSKRKVLLTIGSSILLLVNLYMIFSVGQQAPSHVVISEVYPDAKNETGSEWIELYNPNSYPVDIGGWTIDTSFATPDIIIPEGSIIPPHGFFLIADAGWDTKKDNASWPDADHKEDMRLDNTAGWVRLNNSGIIVDVVGWGGAEEYETSPAVVPNEGESIERKDLVRDCAYGYGYGYGWGPCLDTDNNLFDFIKRENPTPMNSGNKKDPSPVYILVGEPKVIADGNYFVTSTTPIYLVINDTLVGNWTLHWRIWYNGNYIEWENVTINASSEDITIFLFNDGIYYLEFYVNNIICNRYPENGWHSQIFYADNTPPILYKIHQEGEYIEHEQEKLSPGIGMPWQIWEMESPEEITDIIRLHENVAEPVWIKREYAISPEWVPLINLTWNDTMLSLLSWIEIDTSPYKLSPGDEAIANISIDATTKAVIVRYVVYNYSLVEYAHVINEVLLNDSEMVGWLTNFDVHNYLDIEVDNFELKLYNVTISDILGWYYDYAIPNPFLLNNTWYGGWGNSPIIKNISGGIEIKWIDTNHPVEPCQWVHFGLYMVPGINITGAIANWTKIIHPPYIKACSPIIIEGEDLSEIKGIYWGFMYNGTWHPSNETDIYDENVPAIERYGRWWYNYTKPIHFYEECRHEVFYWAEDILNHSTPIYRQEYHVDATPPYTDKHKEGVAYMKNKWALICVSTNDFEGNFDQDGFPAQGLQAYYALKAHGYDDDHIIFMLWHDDDWPSNDTWIDIYPPAGSHNWLYGPDGIAGTADDPVIDFDHATPITKDLLKQQIQWIASQVKPNDEVLIYLVNHGYKNSTGVAFFEFEDPGTDFSYSNMVSSYEMAQWLTRILNNLTTGKLIFFLDACHSGDFIQQMNLTNTIHVASSGNCNLSWYWMWASSSHFAGSWFFHPFWERLNGGWSILQAYQWARAFKPNQTPPPYGETVADIQDPWIIDNVGNADVNSPLNGEYITSQTKIHLNATDAGSCSTKRYVIYYRIWNESYGWTGWQNGSLNENITIVLEGNGKHYI
ncbi:MAG: hypothetical protein DRN11_04445, partial [Thermoplasmata archaeon]